MGNTYKFGEKSKLISFRVPESRDKEYRQIIQKFIDNDLNVEDKYQKQVDIISEMFEKGVLKVYPNKLTEKYQKCLGEL
ncbi:hypothetical protein LCGC14_0471700 [marine sediment metagenome]|uniref:Uncharacterized protein n=1 Tax=marine sediment metagenome TaxID=412755 RepID=A0A0F9VKY5_9ZZZZ|nr:MAG: hypothetical protein Lokiarch_25310 [Candidatus Lokiarchaeum sp. GC14_75]HEC37612.1 hypothetical protein [bacterium]